jgi:putative nucleotidyltransferase with HDIG domain
MEKRIPAKDLAPGMYLVRYGEGTFVQPLVHIDRRLMTPEDIREAVPDDVEEVVIDTGKGLAAPSAAQPGQTTLDEELPIAEKLYSEAVAYARVFMDEVRRGRPLDYRESLPLVNSFIASVFRNEAASASLSRLRKFDEYTFTHSTNVSILSVILGKHLGLSREELELVGVAGLFHDVGKARIPEQILNKPGKLTSREFQIMQGHTLEGYRVLSAQPGIHQDVLKAVVEHHERYDGRGYPRHITGEKMGRYSRILAVVDVYDALTSKRVYKPAIAPSRALGMLYTWREQEFHPDHVEGFIKCMGVYPVGSFVRLRGGEYAVVCDANPSHPLKPKVKIVFDAKMRRRPHQMVDLSELQDDASPPITECLNPMDYKVDVARLL